MVASRNEQNTALALTALLHVGFLALVLLSSRWMPARSQLAASGKPVNATLMVSSADVERAQKAMAAARSEPPPKPEKPRAQPIPELLPQTSEAPLQLTAQEQLVKPDTVDQQAVSQLAQEQAEQRALEEQEQRRRQEQIDLTDDIARSQEAESRQRLREQYEAVRLEREQASKRTRLEELKLQQLADRSTVPEPRPGPTPAAANPGNNGPDNGLRSRYIAAVNATARANWNTLQAPRLVHCQVTFFQIPGGTVTRVEFMNCPYDSEAKDSVERALLKTPMPYAGFEPVFDRQFRIEFCYPEEACQR